MEPRIRLYLLIPALAAGVIWGVVPAAHARVLLTQKQALDLAFPSGVKVERKTAFLSDEQQKAAEQDAQSKIESKVWTYYVGTSSAGIAGTAYFESHLVRTMNETFMVLVDPDSTVRFIEILSFAEPDEFQAPKKWLKQFEGKALDGELLLHRGLRDITGASLTSDAVTKGVRRVLAVHRVLTGKPPAKK